MLWVLKESSHGDGAFEHPKHMFKGMYKKIITIYTKYFCLSEPMHDLFAKSKDTSMPAQVRCIANANDCYSLHLR